MTRRHPSAGATKRRVAVLVTAGIGAGALSFGPLISAASAHITVSAATAVQGTVTTVSFQVPTEKEVPTTKVVVAMPVDTPISEVLVHPKAGWTYAVTMAKPSTPVKNDDGDTVREIVSRVTWTATGAGIEPNEYDSFDILAGPLPKVGEVVFKVLQTYKDGSVVSWIEQQTKGGPEPDYPAPMLALSAQSRSGGTADAVSGSSVAPAASSDSSGSTAEVLGGTGLGLGLVALALAGYAVFRTRRATG